MLARKPGWQLRRSLPSIRDPIPCPPRLLAARVPLPAAFETGCVRDRHCPFVAVRDDERDVRVREPNASLPFDFPLTIAATESLCPRLLPWPSPSVVRARPASGSGGLTYTRPPAHCSFARSARRLAPHTWLARTAATTWVVSSSRRTDRPITVVRPVGAARHAAPRPRAATCSRRSLWPLSATGEDRQTAATFLCRDVASPGARRLDCPAASNRPVSLILRPGRCPIAFVRCAEMTGPGGAELSGRIPSVGDGPRRPSCRSRSLGRSLR